MHDQDVIIIGAGAAGLMCAIAAGKRGKKALLLDHAEVIGEKIRISGGGRCNFTNMHCTPSNFLSENPHFAVSALKRFGPRDIVAMVEAYGIAYHEKTLGQLFCDGPAQQIIDMLFREVGGHGGRILKGSHISAVERRDDGFIIATDRGPFSAPKLVIATGGKSIPKIGATGFGYDIARQFGLNIIAPRPGLVPLTFSDDLRAAFAALAGVSLDAVVSHGKTRFREALLFTHRGLSGPAILQISSYWREGDAIEIDLVPDADLVTALKTAKSENGKQTLGGALAAHVPKRLAQYFADASNQRDTRLADLTDKRLTAIAQGLKAWRVRPSGSEGYRTAEVTLGGVDTKALSSKTMEATQVPGLYFIGEVVDVTGHLGGHNFQWAWASGHACGKAV